MNESERAGDGADPIAPDALTPISGVLLQLRQDRKEGGKPVTLGAIARALRDRSFGAFLLVFAAPNLLPLPPGTSMVLGLPLLFIAWQMATGRDRVYLVRFLARRSLSYDRFSQIIGRVAPWMQRAERLVKPRYWPLSNQSSNRLIGFIVLLLSLMVIVPVPLGNWVPAFAIALLGVALSERDGYWLIAGIIAGIAGTALIILLFFAAGQIAEEVLN